MIAVIRDRQPPSGWRECEAVGLGQPLEDLEARMLIESERRIRALAVERDRGRTQVACGEVIVARRDERHTVGEVEPGTSSRDFERGFGGERFGDRAPEDRDRAAPLRDREHLAVRRRRKRDVVRIKTIWNRLQQEYAR